MPDVTKSRSGLIDCTGESVANHLYVLNVVYYLSCDWSYFFVDDLIATQFLVQLLLRTNTIFKSRGFRRAHGDYLL